MERTWFDQSQEDCRSAFLIQGGQDTDHRSGEIRINSERDGDSSGGKGGLEIKAKSSSSLKESKRRCIGEAMAPKSSQQASKSSCMSEISLHSGGKNRATAERHVRGLLNHGWRSRSRLKRAGTAGQRRQVKTGPNQCREEKQGRSDLDGSLIDRRNRTGYQVTKKVANQMAVGIGVLMRGFI